MNMQNGIPESDNDEYTKPPGFVAALVLLALAVIMLSVLTFVIVFLWKAIFWLVNL